MPVFFLILGGLASAFALILEILLIPGAGYGSTGLSHLVLAALIEESAALLFLWRGFRTFPETLLRTRLANGALFAIGFSIPETWLAIQGSAPLFTPLAVFGLHLGSALILASSLAPGAQRSKRVGFAFALAIALHLLYNGLVFLFSS
ncbi:MAG: hypothetical protein WDN67_01085 [Candidatus Moraniibacteriota bacterium]